MAAGWYGVRAEFPRVSDHWSRYVERWARLRPPLRPHPAVVGAVAELLADVGGPALLLGVTPELAAVTPALTAVDADAARIRGLWRGGSGRSAVIADWRALPFAPGSFGAVVGDGSLNVLPDAESQAAALGEIGRVLAVSGVAVVRVFCRPTRAEQVTELFRLAPRGDEPSFDAFKWRVAMALAADRAGRVAVEDLRAAFPVEPEQRRALAARAGWALEDLETIDVYEGSAATYVFPSEGELEERLPATLETVEWRRVTGYPLAERCPLWVMARARGSRA